METVFVWPRVGSSSMALWT